MANQIFGLSCFQTIEYSLFRSNWHNVCDKRENIERFSIGKLFTLKCPKFSHKLWKDGRIRCRNEFFDWYKYHARKNLIRFWGHVLINIIYVAPFFYRPQTLDSITFYSLYHINSLFAAINVFDHFYAFLPFLFCHFFLPCALFRYSFALYCITF